MIDYSFASKQFGELLPVFLIAGFSFAVGFLFSHALLGGLGFFEWLLSTFGSIEGRLSGDISLREFGNLASAFRVGFVAAGIGIGLPLIFVSCHLYVCANKADDTLPSRQEAKVAASWAVVDDMIYQEMVKNWPNSSDELYEELVSIKGCGPATAQRIIAKLPDQNALTSREQGFLDEAGWGLLPQYL